MDDITPFLRVPAEIRLAIYKLLLLDHDDKTLRIGTEAPLIYWKRKREQRKRCKFRFIVDRMHSRSDESTYCLKRATYQETHAAILGVNHQIHEEAARVLYHEHIFDFDMDIECIVPFLDDLTPVALSSIKRLKMVKRSLPYTKHFDRYEWRNACNFIAENMRSKNMQLQLLDLYVYCGTPSLANKPTMHWKQYDIYTQSDFSIISRLADMEEDMEWARHVVAIKGLRLLNVTALLEDYPIPESMTMAFSASIEKGFTAYLRSLMFAQAS